jgi:hypothetical protein
MPGSPTARGAYPLRLKFALRVMVVTIAILGLSQLIERKTVESLIPLFRTTMWLLDSTFVINDARIAESGANETLRLRANLARPITIEGRIVYPFGWNGRPAGGFQVTYTVGGVLAYSAFMLIIVLSWPVRDIKEFALRLLFSIPLVAILLLLDVPTTMTAELWNAVDALLDTHQVSLWMTWSRFLMGGGGFVIASVLAVAAIALAERVSKPEWQTVSFRELDMFLRKYPRALDVEPPWNRPARRRYVKEMSPDTQHPHIVARCRYSGDSIQCQVRKALWGDESDQAH